MVCPPLDIWLFAPFKQNPVAKMQHFRLILILQNDFKELDLIKI